MTTPDARPGTPSAARGPVLVVTGMQSEAAILRKARRESGRALAGCDIHVGFGAAAGSERIAALARGASAIVSFGTAGALDPLWQPGDCVLATEVVNDAGTVFVCDADWRETLLADLHDRCNGPMQRVRAGRLAGATQAVVSAGAKARRFQETGAVAVDMESHWLAQLAAGLGLPFLACRIVVDRSDHTLPPAALAALAPDGRTRLLPVLLELARAPGQLPSLLRLGRDSAAATRTMTAIAGSVTPGFGGARTKPS